MIKPVTHVFVSTGVLRPEEAAGGEQGCRAA